MKSFLGGRWFGLQFEARVRAVQETDAYFARVSSIRWRRPSAWRLPSAQGKVKTVLPREPFVPAAYIEQLVDKGSPMGN